MTAGPLTLEDLERLDGKAREFYRLGLTHGGMGDDVLRLTTALRSVMAENDRLQALCDRVREAWADPRHDFGHLPNNGCDKIGFMPTTGHYETARPCSCGFDALRAAIEALGPECPHRPAGEP